MLGAASRPALTDVQRHHGRLLCRRDHQKPVIVVAALGIVRSAYLLVLTLIWTHDAFAVFHKTEARIAMRNSNTDTQALAFVGLLCVPGLWEILEYLSLLALIAFLPIAVAL